MQGSDFPIKKKSEISKFFIDHDGREFIHFDPEWYEFGKYKINHHHFLVNNKYYRNSNLLKAVSHGIAKAEQRIGYSRNNIRIYSGSAVFSITNDLCAYFLNNENRILELSRHSLAADEVVFQTLVMESAFKEKLFSFEEHGGNLYYIDWSRREGSSPCTFSDENYEELISLPYPYMFARKFTELRSKSLIQKLYDALKEDSY